MRNCTFGETGTLAKASDYRDNLRPAKKGTSNMLESSLFESQARKRTRKPITVAIAATAHGEPVEVVTTVTVTFTLQ